MLNSMRVGRSRAMLAAATEDAAAPVRCLRLGLGLGAPLPGPGPPREQLKFAYQLARCPRSSLRLRQENAHVPEACEANLETLEADLETLEANRETLEANREGCEANLTRT
jgi:hypothetical protein